MPVQGDDGGVVTREPIGAHGARRSPAFEGPQLMSDPKRRARSPRPTRRSPSPASRADRRTPVPASLRAQPEASLATGSLRRHHELLLDSIRYYRGFKQQLILEHFDRVALRPATETGARELPIVDPELAMLDACERLLLLRPRRLAPVSPMLTLAWNPATLALLARAVETFRDEVETALALGAVIAGARLDGTAPGSQPLEASLVAGSPTYQALCQLEGSLLHAALAFDGDDTGAAPAAGAASGPRLGAAAALGGVIAMLAVD
jgi:hypothetical protein